MHGFVRRPGGEIVSFDVPESTGTIATSINDVGAIAGSYIAANGLSFGFVRDRLGKFTSFDIPGLQSNIQVTSINNEGAITGLGFVIAARSLAFVRSPDGTITFTNPGGCLLYVTLSINDEGVITGSCNTGFGPPRGWVRFP